MVRGSSLSDETVIKEINDNFVAVEHNISDKGFPKSATGLKLWEHAFKRNWKHKFAFATSVVLTPDGKMPLGTSGSGYRWEWETSANYHPNLYLAFLRDSYTRFNKYLSVKDDPSLHPMQRKLKLLALWGEAMKQATQANKRRQNAAKS